jgi:hypothetical protein
MLFALSAQAWAVAASTITVLATSAKTVNLRTIVVLTAKVTDPNLLQQGLVRFQDGKTLLGSAQIVNTGTKYTHGTANLSVQLGPGSHVLKAVFAGTSTNAGSSSATHTVIVGGGTSATTISYTGTSGNYTLTSQVVANSLLPPTGQVSFLDQTSNNDSIGEASLGAATLANTFAKSVSYDIYDKADHAYPNQVLVGDLNGDGILDFIELDNSGAAASVHLGKGDGTFWPAIPSCTTGTPPVQCYVGSEPLAIALADFNSDGIPDLVVAFNNSVGVMMGKGDGTFLPETDYDTGSAARNVVVGDFDRDGSPDIAAGIDGGVAIFIGNGDGTVQPSNDISLSTSGDLMTIGDFNKDGILDLALADESSFDILLGVGDGTFQKEEYKSTDINPGDGNIVATDFKGAGYLCDLALSGGYGVETMIGNGDGTFQSPTMLLADSGFYPHVMGFTAADLSGDGFVDLALAWYTSTTGTGRVAVFSGKGDGTFNPTPKTLNVGAEPVTIAAGDFDGNGIPDLVVGNTNDGTLSVILSSATATASATLANVKVPGTGTQNVFARFLGDTSYTSSDSTTVALTGDGVAAPVLASVSPATAVAGGPAFTLSVTGSGFATGAVVKWNGSARATAFVSATKLTAAILATDIVSLGTYPVTVTTGGITTASLTFAVTSPPSVLTSLSPDTTVKGGSAFTLTVNGSGFTTGAIVKFNGNARTTAFISATRLTSAIQATDIAIIGSYPVTVTSGGATSNALAFTVTAVPPVLTSLSPATANTGGAAFTLTVNGSGLATGAVVKWNGNARTTAFVSATKLTATILATDISTAGSYPVTVTSGGATSSALIFAVTSVISTPILTSISPNYVSVEAPALTLTVNGSNFLSGTSASTIYWNTTKLTTTFVSSTRLTASIPASDLTADGTYAITVTNPGPLTSNAVAFTVGPATHSPLAYGFFSLAGMAGASSGNISCTWSTAEYLCTVTGEKFFYSKYIVNVTPADTTTPAMATVNSVGGQIVVKIYNLSGTAIQDPFYITVYKP